MRLTSDRVATGIKLALDKAGIDMPYPHSVVLFHNATGTRDGDIEQVKYLSAAQMKQATENQDGGDSSK